MNYEEAYSIVVPDEENRDHAEVNPLTCTVLACVWRAFCVACPRHCSALRHIPMRPTCR